MTERKMMVTGLIKCRDSMTTPSVSTNSNYKAPTSDGSNNGKIPLASEASPNAYISYSTTQNESHITSIISSSYIKTKINSIEV
mgnify:FL=1